MKQKLCFIGLLTAILGVCQTPQLVIPKGHTGGITSISFQKNGKYLATGSRDFTAKIWDLKTHEIQTFRLSTEIQAVAFSPDGKFILIGSTDGKVTLWKITGELVQTFTGHKNFINSVSFSPDGNSILSGSDDKTARLWDLKGKLLKSFNHSAEVTSAEFTPDNKSVITGSLDKTAVQWNLNGNKIRTFIGHKGGVLQVRISKDGNYVITGSADRTAILWDIKGNKLRQINHPDKIQACDITTDNKKIITGSFDGTVKIWNLLGKELLTYKAHDWGLCTIRFSPDDNSFITACEDNHIKHWDLSGHKIQLFDGHARNINSVGISANGNSIVLGCNENTAKLWDILHNKYQSFNGHKGKINSVAITTSGDSILTGSEDKTAKLWDKSGKELQTFKLAASVTAVAFSTGGNKILTGCFDGCTKVWESSGKEIILLKQTEKVTTAAFSPDGKSVATGSYEGIIKHYNMNGSLITTINAMSQVNSLCFSSDGKIIFSALANGFAKLWDAKSGESTMTLGNFGDELLSISTSNDGKLAATGDYKGNIKLWDLQTNNVKVLVGHTSKVKSLSFSKDNNYLLSGSSDGTTKIWNCAAKKELLTLVSIDSLDWVVTNPDGLFDASPGAMDIMNYVVGLEVVELNQLKERYYEPGLLGSSLHILDNKTRDVSTFSSLALFPELNASIQKQTLNVNLKIRNGGMGKLSLFVNDKEVVEDINPERKPELKIDLDNFNKYYFGDTNKISLIVYNQDGWLKSQSLDLNYLISVASKGEPSGNNQEQPTIFKGKPSLYALVVGTSDYSGDKLDLRFPDLDATSFSEGLKAVGSKLFETRVTVKLLTTSGKTSEEISSRGNIEKAFKDIAGKATPGDVIVVYFSGHGTTYGEAEKSQFYYLTKDIVSENLSDPDIRKNYTISSDDLTKWLTAIAARKQVMIFDACHSGKVVESLSELGARDLNPSQIKALDRMKDRTGMFILTGSAADKVSYEASQYGQGLLTYSLLQGMSGLALTDDKRVDVATLFQYSREKVPELAKGINKIQIPVVAFPKGGGSFDIGIVDNTVKIPLAQIKPVFIRNILQDEKVFGDPLQLNESLSNYFREITARGPDAELIYVDVNEYENAYSINGFYNITNNELSLRVKLFKGKKPIGEEFKVIGDKNNIPSFIDLLMDKVYPLISKN